MNDFQLTNPENPDLCDPSKSQWYTPDDLAARIVDWACDGHDVRSALEPSCGRGALVKPLYWRVKHLMGFDIDPANVKHCRELFPDYSVFYEGNFLEQDATLYMNAPLDLAVLNPPFEDGQAEQHILHALTFAKRVVAHVPLTTLAGRDRYLGLWSEVYLKRMVFHATRPKYSGNKNGGMTDMLTMEVVRRPEGHTRGAVAASGVNVEWWL